MIIINHDLPPLQQFLHSQSDKLTNLLPLMDAIGQAMENSTNARFASKKDPTGVTWVSLMPKSLEAKRRKDGKIGGGGILVKSGNLRDGISYQPTATSVSIGTNEVYGGYHQFGTRHLPQRAFLGISDEDKGTINAVIEAFFKP